MAQEPIIYRQPDITLEFADCIEYINIPIKNSDIGESFTLDENGVECIIKDHCVNDVEFILSLPQGVEYESSSLTHGTYDPQTETINIPTLCTGEIFSGTIKIKVTDDCSYPFKVGVTMTDKEKCLTYEATQITKVDAKMTCKRILNCRKQGLDCSEPLTK